MRVEASVVIGRPRSEIWQYLAMPSNTTAYFSHMVSYEATSPLPLQEGSTMAGAMRHGPLRATLNQVVTRVVEGEVLEWKDLNKDLPTVQSYTLTEVDGGTKVVYRVDGSPQTLIGRVAAPLVTSLTHSDAWSSLDRLKQVLESRPPVA